MGLTANVAVASRGLDVSLAIGSGRTCAVLGPNGAGKSTLLEIVAGLIQPDAGTVELDGRLLTGQGVWVPPHQRHLALLSAHPRLFPHLSVLANVAFGPRSRGASRSDADVVARSWLDQLGALDWARRRAADLSTGQAQRVALARALATDPELLLLDEPFAALDVGVAATMRMTMAEILADRTAILVTHELLDVAVLAADVVVIDDGHVVEEGPADRVLRRPGSDFAAGLCGVNLLRGRASSADEVEVPGFGNLRGVADESLVAGVPALALFPPAAVSLHARMPEGSPRNQFPATVDMLEPHGPLVRVRLGDIAADVTPDAVAAMALRPGAHVYLAVKAAEVAVYPTAPSTRIRPLGYPPVT